MKRYNYSPSVNRRIAEYQNNNEIIITYLQLGILVLISLFYTFAPKGFEGMEVFFQPVPYALGIWFAVLVVRFTLCYARRMRGALVPIFIVVDMFLLLGLIYSYSVQYQVSAALSLKAPTFIFLLFFIVLRALRFEIRYIIFGYIVAVVGWAALTFVAYVTSEVTHNFIVYATSNTVLLGAEIERVLALSACSLVLVLVVWQSRRALVSAHRQEDRVRNLSLFFNQNVAKRIAAEDETIHPGKGEERHGVVMSIDIRNFTRFSATHGIDEVMNTISTYQERMIGVVHKNSGSVDKFMGDGILIHFGIADDSPHYAASALRAGEQIIEAMETWNREREAKQLDPIHIGVGMDVGKVLFGTVGDESRLEFTIIGNAVNLATKLEKETKNYPGYILLTKAAFDAARQQGYAPACKPFLIRKQQIAGEKDLDVVILLTEKQRQQLPAK